MSRKFGPISTSIWDSDKFSELSCDLHRLGYIYLLACPHGNGVGVFKAPAKYISVDLSTKTRDVTIEEADAMLNDCARVGLIERGDDEAIRMIDWFFHQSGASNPSQICAFCKFFNDRSLVKRSELRTRAAAEMVIASLQKCEVWNPESKPFGVMIKDIQKFIKSEIERDPEGFITALEQHPRPDIGTVAHMVFDTVSHTMPDTVSHMMGHIIHRNRRQKENKKPMTEEERETERERETRGDARGDDPPDLDVLSRKRAIRAGRTLPPDIAEKIEMQRKEAEKG